MKRNKDVIKKCPVCKKELNHCECCPVCKKRKEDCTCNNDEHNH